MLYIASEDSKLYLANAVKYYYQTINTLFISNKEINADWQHTCSQLHADSMDTADVSAIYCCLSSPYGGPAFCIIIVQHFNHCFLLSA